MDELLDYITSHGDEKELRAAVLDGYLDKAYYDEQKGYQFEEDSYRYVKSAISALDTIQVADVIALLQLLLPQLQSTVEGMSRVQPSIQAAADAALPASYTGNIIDEANNDGSSAQAVPVASVPQSGTGIAPLESHSRKRTSPIRRQLPSSTAEGSRLRGRNLAAMTNAEYDALASAIQPALANEISTYAAQAGIGPSGGTRPAADGRAHTDHTPLSDPELSGFSTPHVSRKAIRQRMRTVARTSLPATGAFEVPISPESSFHDPVSPLRYAEPDDGSKQHIEQLLGKKTELQKMVADRERRIELIENQYEKRTVTLEREIDECKGQLTTLKREIERLKQSEKSYIENLQTAEGEIERIGVNLSNSTAQATELRRQLDTKTVQLAESNNRVLEHQSEIVGLRAGLGANHQQQDQLAREHHRLELQFRELEHELKAAREFRVEAAAERKENLRLSETIEVLKQELAELRLREQQSQTAGADDPAAAAGQPHARRRYRSLQDELAANGGQDAAGVDDATHDGRPRSVAAAKRNVAVGTTSADAQELGDAAVREWIGEALGRCSAEDLVVLNEVWRRVEYCDTGTESQAELRRELIEVFMAPNKYGLKEALRSRSNPTLTRIVDGVAGEYMRMSAGHRHGEKGTRASARGAPGLAQVLAGGQYTTAAIILYSVVIFCLGIITASYFNLAQPMATSMPLGVANGTAPGAGDGGMSVMRQILVVDDTPVHKYYTPLRKRNPRSRLGEILFYWAETLLWDDTDTQVPT
ncbi:hypothetical protein LPJ61_002478 [Coemansia biformis]|uniref:Uncharacterized protein n=1 Tax=Coemansia biformis TaxID=1286918 RepID=A0A9W7YFQ5_9FUNG|nr:hypothetical protein LPJ61_002478 [Coemansia biformis]